MGRKDFVTNKLDDVPPVIDIIGGIMHVAQLLSALVVVLLFSIGVIDLVILIYELYLTDSISDVESVIGLVEFVLLLFIIVEVYRTIVAYITNKEAEHVVNIVVYAGVIAVIRKLIVFQPDEFSGTEIVFTLVGYAAVLLSLGLLIYIVHEEGLVSD